MKKKKIKINDFVLDKEVVSRLTTDDMTQIKGGGFLSIGKSCTKKSKCTCSGGGGSTKTKWTKGIFCNP